MFFYTLSGPVKAWFRTLKACSVSILKQLLTEFIHEFSYTSSQDQAAFKLAFIRQGEFDTLVKYVTRFRQEVLRIGAFGHQ